MRNNLQRLRGLLLPSPDHRRRRKPVEHPSDRSEISTPRDNTDRFEQSHAIWPLKEGHYHAVYVVSQQIRHKDPPLMTQLMAAEERNNAHRNEIQRTVP